MFDEINEELKTFRKQLRQILFNQAMIMDAIEPILEDDEKKKNLQGAMIRTAKAMGMEIDWL